MMKVFSGVVLVDVYISYAEGCEFHQPSPVNYVWQFSVNGGPLVPNPVIAITGPTTVNFNLISTDGFQLVYANMCTEAWMPVTSQISGIAITNSLISIVDQGLAERTFGFQLIAEDLSLANPNKFGGYFKNMPIISPDPQVTHGE